MYRDYYLEVIDVAKKIRANPMSPPVEVEREGFMQPRKEDLVGAISGEDTPFENTLLDYMKTVRETSTTGRYEESLPVSVEKGGLDTAMNAIASVESGGNYQAIGPEVTKGAYKGDKAYGKYQVMGKNIPVWSREILGFELTPEEFLSNPRYQDMIAGAKLAQAKDKYGTWEDAASVWFSGRPLSKAGNASDGYNTVPQYIDKFKKAMA